MNTKCIKLKPSPCHGSSMLRARNASHCEWVKHGGSDEKKRKAKKKTSNEWKHKGNRFDFIFSCSTFFPCRFASVHQSRNDCASQPFQLYETYLDVVESQTPGLHRTDRSRYTNEERKKWREREKRLNVKIKPFSIFGIGCFHRLFGQTAAQRSAKKSISWKWMWCER